MQKVRIDFDNPGLPQHISAVENDSQSRFFQATLYENGKAYTAPEGAAYSIMYRGFGPQNQGWYDTINDGAGKRAACNVSGNVVTCEIARQALQVPGHVSIVLCVTTGKGYMLKSWPIECDCKNDRYDSTAEIESFFYITQVSNADWNRAIQALEELKNIIDPTLSLSGKAADAKATGAAVSKLEDKKADKTDLETERKRIDVLNEGGLNLKDDVIDTSIKAWLTEHPEATTTVQDGAITEAKIAAEFLPYISNSYITPQMFGAKGDGVSDDTESIASCFAYARVQKSVIFFPAGNYGISKPLSVNFDIKIIGENAFIIPLKEMTHFMGINTSEKTNSGYISGLGFSAGNAFSVSTGVKISYVANFRLHGLKIFNTTVGIDCIAGYDLLVDSCLIRTSIPSTESIGVDIKTSDSHFSNTIIVNYHTGIYDRNGGNFYDKIHAWIANSDIVKGSIYFRANGSAYLSQCFNDTYETAIYINGQLNVIVSGFRNLYNSEYINSDVIDDVPVLFYISNGKENQNLKCFGVSVPDVGSLFNGKKPKFSNVGKEKWNTNFKSLSPDSLSVYCDGVPDGLIVYNPGIAVATSSEASLWDIKYNRIYRSGRYCKLEFAALYKGTATNLNFNFVSQWTRPANAKELFVSLSKTQYDIPNALAYLYIGGGLLNLKLPDSESKFVHFDVDYYAN